jgi:hypothetical protein
MKSFVTYTPKDEMGRACSNNGERQDTVGKSGRKEATETKMYAGGY